MQALSFMVVHSPRIAIGFSPDFFRQLQARVKFVCLFVCYNSMANV